MTTWRQRWSQNSDSNPEFPFGLVQIAGYREGHKGYEFPVLRWHQSADLGYVPNEQRPNAYMAVSLDAYDKDGDSLHPRDKKVNWRR